jgi:polysaccharide biosynthesis/export protein
MFPNKTLILAISINIMLFIPVSIAGAQSLMDEGKVYQASLIDRSGITSSYRIAPGDTLTFSINEEPDFTQKDIIVRSDGYATIQPVGEVSVAGMSIKQLSEILEVRLLPYINKPEVYISIQDFHTPTVYLFGAVKSPGLYNPHKNTAKTSGNHPKLSKSGGLQSLRLTISNILINSGGVDYDADLTNIKLTRLNGEEKNIDLTSLYFFNDKFQDVLVEEGDVIHVGKRADATLNDSEFQILTSAGIYPAQFPVRVMGEVSKPGLYYLEADSPGINSVLALAGGFTSTAVKQNIIIHRKVKDEAFTKIILDPNKADIVLRPNDLIEIKRSHFSKVVHGADTTSRIALPYIWFAGSSR